MREGKRTEGGDGPGHGSLGRCRVLRRVDGRGVVGGVEPEHGDVGDPDSVEVDEEVEEGSFLEVGLEEGSSPVDLVELHEPLCRRNVDESSLRERRGEKERGNA